MKILVDASRNRSGGAIEYILGVFSSTSVKNFEGEIHLWAPQTVLSQLLDESSAVVKRSSWMIEANLVFQLLWQAFVLPILLRFEKFDVLFSTDASTLTLFSRHVVMSQDMLSYENDIMSLYPIGLRRIRLKLIYYLQNLAFQRADGVIFLTHYASEKIQEHCGRLANYVVIPHGVHSQNRVATVRDMYKKRKIGLVYVSNSAPYKNQWNVIQAVDSVRRKKGYDLQLMLVGGGSGPAYRRTQAELNNIDPSGEFVRQTGHLERSEVESIVAQSDIYVFASSCENLPITLLEGMSFGLPIVSSDRGPMPEVLRDGGFYFDPDSSEEIAAAIVSTIEDEEKRLSGQDKCFLYSREYTWKKTASQTLTFLKQFA